MCETERENVEDDAEEEGMRMLKCGAGREMDARKQKGISGRGSSEKNKQQERGDWRTTAAQERGPSAHCSRSFPGKRERRAAKLGIDVQDLRGQSSYVRTAQAQRALDL